MCADLLRREQERNALPAGVDNKAGLRSRLRGQHHTGADRQPIHRSFCLRAERDVGEQALADPRTGPKAKIGRLKRDRGGFETHEHLACAKRRRLKLHDIPVDQLDVCARDRVVADLDNRDRRVGNSSGGSHGFRVLRNSDRPS
jgi:hypothetical protein